MDRAHAVALASYNAWANRRVFARAARVPLHTLRKSASLSYASPLATLVHILDSQWNWRVAVQEGLAWVEPDMQPGDFRSLTALRRRWDEEDRLLLEWLSHLPRRQLAGTVTYGWPKARPRTRPFWAVLTHIVNHATQHRSELAVWLTGRKLSPGNLDFMHYVANIHHVGG